MNPIVLVLITVAAGGLSSLIGAILLGKLVPASRIAVAVAAAEKRAVEAETRADKFQLAYETLRRSSDLLEETVKRQHVVGDTANMLIGMIRQAAVTPPSQPTQAGGPG